MTATATIAAFANLPRFRSIGVDRFVASCPGPLHANGDRNPSLSGSIRGGKLLLKCWAGDSTKDILAAMGLDWSALFIDVPRQRKGPDPKAVRLARASEGLRRWRNAETRWLGEELRNRDRLVRIVDLAVNAGELTEDTAWDFLGVAYQGYSELEDKFDRLLHNESVLELWRESRRVP